MSEKEKRKLANRKYYLANSEKWKKYRQKQKEKAVETVIRILAEREGSRP